MRQNKRPPCPAPGRHHIGNFGRFFLLEQKEAAEITDMMAAGGWAWGPFILAHLGVAPSPAAPPDGRQAAIWHRLADYTDYAPQTEPGTLPVLPDAARQRLHDMLGSASEMRQSQSDYAAAVAMSFDRPDAGPTPALVLAAASTRAGVGPASGRSKLIATAAA